jgi:thioredoxin 1
MSAVKEVNESNFDQEVLQSTIPVLVDFWAPWCGPCRLVAPTVEEIAKEHAGKVTVVKLNTDEAPTVAARFGIMSIPTLILFKGGQPAAQLIGAQPKQSILEQIQPHF